MRLGDLIAQIDGAAVVAGTPEVDIVNVELDSRAVSTGTLFCCIPGSSIDGHRFAQDAVDAGASALLTEHAIDSLDAVPEVRVGVGEARTACALLSAAIVGWPARELSMLGVTGTNGKTTVAHLASELLEATGFAPSVIGTLTGARTTPPPPGLHRLLRDALARARDRGRPGAVAMEVSSHALDQDRVGGIEFDVAVFTNLSHDHLDYHGTMERYFDAKARLFEDERARVAVIWAETGWGRALLDARRGETVAVGWGDVSSLTFHADHSTFAWRGVPISLPLIGSHGVIDALLAAESVVALGADPQEVARALGEVTSVTGRMQRVGISDAQPIVLVDYAHTPDALEGAIAESRRIAGEQGTVIVVFGCGGERDQAKRPIMGSIATSLADVAIVTSDNPRSERPEAIAEAIVAGADGPAALVVELDRAAAITSAVEQAAPGDVILIAGKGHETEQVIGDEHRHFDDVEVARRALAHHADGGDGSC